MVNVRESKVCFATIAFTAELTLMISAILQSMYLDDSHTSVFHFTEILVTNNLIGDKQKGLFSSLASHFKLAKIQLSS